MKIKYLTLNAYWNKFIKIFTVRKERYYFCRENRLLIKENREYFSREKEKFKITSVNASKKKNTKTDD